MSSAVISILVVICCCASAAIGITLHIKLPDRHFDSDSKDVVKSVMAVVATMAALVLGLLIASAKSSFDTQATDIQQLSANVVQLDRVLALYGSETGEARKLLRGMVIGTHERIWPADANQKLDLNPSGNWGFAQPLYVSLEKLSPANDTQRRAQTMALGLAAELSHARLLMFEQIGGATSWQLLVVLIFWLSVLFLGFGLFARPSIIIVGAFLVGSVSVGSAFFLILELSQPYGGFMQVPDIAVQKALVELNRSY